MYYINLTRTFAERVSQILQKAFENLSVEIGSPFTWILSLMLTKCGDVYIPVWIPEWRRMDSVKAHTDPFPDEIKRRSHLIKTFRS